MKVSKAWTVASLLALAAAGPALAQSAGASAGGSAGASGGISAGTSGTGSAGASAGGSTTAGGTSAGTTGVVTGSGTGSATVTATGVAPADGSNAAALPPDYASLPASPDVALAAYRVLPGAVVVPAAVVSAVDGNSRVTVTRYWVNVPAGVEQHASFQRWQRLM